MEPPSATGKESVGLDRRLDIIGRSLSCDLSSGADGEVGAKDRERSRGISGEGMAAMPRWRGFHSVLQWGHGEAKVSNNVFFRKWLPNPNCGVHIFFLDYRMLYEWAWHHTSAS